jgi:hypothetical protein
MEDKEHTRKTGEAIVVSTYPDVCKSPIAPVPYTINAPFMMAINTANTVDATKDPTFTMMSRIPLVIGDEGGTGEGVKSGTHAGSGVCWPIEWSPTVKAEGQNVVRNDDKFEMNKGNTEGKAVYKKDGFLQSVKDFAENHHLATRAMGLWNAVGGVGEMDLGAGIAAIPGLELVGGAIALHGADVTQAGVRQAISGEETPTFTEQYLGKDVDDAMSVPGMFDNGRIVVKAVQKARNGTRIVGAAKDAVKEMYVDPFKTLPGKVEDAAAHGFSYAPSLVGP